MDKDIAYNSISNAIEYIQNECHEHPVCINCKFLSDKDNRCMFDKPPCRWNSKTIKNSVKGE